MVKKKTKIIKYSMVVYIKYGIGHTIAAFQIKYGPYQQSPFKRSEAHGNENNLLGQTFSLKSATH
jgi:hypothetical protein